jgi:hypothetical protein
MSIRPLIFDSLDVERLARLPQLYCVLRLIRKRMKRVLKFTLGVFLYIYLSWVRRENVTIVMPRRVTQVPFLLLATLCTGASTARDLS